jgi:hypothetical protein
MTKGAHDDPSTENPLARIYANGHRTLPTDEPVAGGAHPRTSSRSQSARAPRPSPTPGLGWTFDSWSDLRRIERAWKAKREDFLAELDAGGRHHQRTPRDHRGSSLM